MLEKYHNTESLRYKLNIQDKHDKEIVGDSKWVIEAFGITCAIFDSLYVVSCW